VKSFVHELSRVGNYGLTLLFPRACDLCGGSVEELGDGAACANCWEETELFDGSVSFCWKCGMPAGAAGAPADPEKIRCRQCDDDHYDAVRSLGGYAGALRASVLALKRQPEVPGRLLDLLTALAQTEPLNRTQVVMPVPLHPERERERGFNQASALAEAIAKTLGLPLDDTALIRAQHTARHRAEMDARARRESVEGVFQVAYPRRVRVRTILLVDDVQTTGATLSACAQVLKAAGATQVFGLTIARAR
jgi:ComF family protein